MFSEAKQELGRMEADRMRLLREVSMTDPKDMAQYISGRRQK